MANKFLSDGSFLSSFLADGNTAPDSICGPSGVCSTGGYQETLGGSSHSPTRHFLNYAGDDSTGPAPYNKITQSQLQYALPDTMYSSANGATENSVYHPPPPPQQPPQPPPQLFIQPPNSNSLCNPMSPMGCLLPPPPHQYTQSPPPHQYTQPPPPQLYTQPPPPHQQHLYQYQPTNLHYSLPVPSEPMYHSSPPSHQTLQYVLPVSLHAPQFQQPIVQAVQDQPKPPRTAEPATREDNTSSNPAAAFPLKYNSVPDEVWKLPDAARDGPPNAASPPPPPKRRRFTERPQTAPAAVQVESVSAAGTTGTDDIKEQLRPTTAIVSAVLDNTVGNGNSPQSPQEVTGGGGYTGTYSLKPGHRPDADNAPTAAERQLQAVKHLTDTSDKSAKDRDTYEECVESGGAIEGGTWEHRMRAKEMVNTANLAAKITEISRAAKARGGTGLAGYLPAENDLQAFNSDSTTVTAPRIRASNKGYQMLKQSGWTDGEGLGSMKDGFVEPVAALPQTVFGTEANTATEDVSGDPFEAYRNRMMMAYRFRPNPLNNPRRSYDGYKTLYDKNKLDTTLQTILDKEESK
eukprot:Lankesteria_metandrocarpae@DN10503_c0_g1_i1.p1